MRAHQVTDLQGLAPLARRLITAALEERLGPVTAAFDFYREWNGGWRCRVDVTGRGRLEFVLFTSDAGALLALPHPLPPRWHDARGFAADDGTRWTFDGDGQVVQCSAADTPA